MDQPEKQVISQLIVLLLQVFFTQLKLSGKTDNEIHQIFLTEKAKFDSRNPNDLPDV